MEDMRDEAALAARLAERKEVASRLLKKGAMSFEEIAEISQLSVEAVSYTHLLQKVYHLERNGTMENFLNI